MVKFGKCYRNSQLAEWRKYYINYKLLKQKIKAIKRKVESRPRDGTINLNKNRIMTSLNVIPLVSRTYSLFAKIWPRPKRIY